jgi:hypothetical protein
MIGTGFPSVIGFFLLWTMSARAADKIGLQQQSSTKITSQMVGAPFEGDHPPFVWAISISPDSKNVAVGVQFARKKKSLSFHSYLLVFPVDRPGVVLRNVETPTQVELRGLHSIVWSSDSRFLAVTPWGDWDHAAVMQLTDGHLDVFPDRVGVPWCGGAAGLVPGPRIVQQCTLQGNTDTAVRFLSIDGTVAPQWTFQGVIGLMQVSPDGRMLALDLSGASGKSPLLRSHDVVVLNIADRTEVARWSLPEAMAYGGTFANSGKAFCTVPDPTNVNSEHEVVCRNIIGSDVISKFIVPKGPVGIGATGDKLLLRHSGVAILPFRLFGTNYILGGTNQYISDLQTGRAIAAWQIPTMDDVNFASSVSEDGRMVAIADSGSIRVYQVSNGSLPTGAAFHHRLLD